MDYDVSDLLDNLFGQAMPTAAPVVAQYVAPPEPIPKPEESDTLAGDTLAASDDELAEPGPACPKCGSLESWTDLLGRRRCGICEREVLEKAIQLAEQAARLRELAQSAKPTPRIAPGCVAVGCHDILDLGGNRPMQGQPRDLCKV